jgi:hypothetical protein
MMGKFPFHIQRSQTEFLGMAFQKGASTRMYQIFGPTALARRTGTARWSE